MAVTQYGTDIPLAPGLKPVRQILTEAGYLNDDIGYNPNTKNITINGKDFAYNGLTSGSDQHYYADPNDFMQQISASGFKPSVPQYTNPYQQQQDAAVKNITNYMQTPFSYDPSIDKGLQQAQKDTERNIREMAGQRNMLYSEGTISNVAQETARLIPQYEQIAYGRWQDEGQRLMQFADFFNQLGQQDYDRFVQKWDMENQARDRARQTKLDQITEEQRKLDNAYKKLDTLDYVDNEISKLTGLPVGTLSSTARRDLQNRQWQLEDFKTQQEAEKQADYRRASIEKEIIDYRAKKDAESQPENMGTPEQLNYFNNAFNYLLTQNGGDGYKAYQQLLRESRDYNASMGTKLFAELGKQLQAYGKSQGTPTSINNAVNFSIDDWGRTLDNEFIPKYDSYGEVINNAVTDQAAREQRILELGLPDDMTEALYKRYNIPLPQ